MNPPLFFLVLLTLLTGALFAQEVEKLSEPKTLLFIRTVPEGARVLIDGKEGGATDNLFSVDPGVRRIVVELDGHAPQSKKVTVLAGQITRLELELKKSESSPEIGPLSFAPVIERVVNDDKTGGDWMIDLDTGKVYTPPTELDPEKNPKVDIGKLMAWVRQQGIDATGIKAQGGELTFVERILAVMDKASWESVTQQQVRDALAEVVDPTDKAVVGDTLYAFRTREGGTGVLQVVARGEDSPSVKVRYKLFRTARNVAADFLTAMRDQDDETIKALATDAVRQGWKEAVPQFAAEICHHLEVFSKSTDPLTRIEEVVVDGDLAAVKAASVKQGYLVLFFRLTPDGWRNCSLKNSPPDVPLAEHLEQYKAKFRDADSRHASDNTQASRILRRYAEAVLTELSGRLREADRGDIEKIAVTVAAELTTRHLMPHADLLAADALARLPKANPADLSHWAEIRLKPEAMKIRDLSGAYYRMTAWNPVTLVNILRRDVAHRELGGEAAGIRSLLEAAAPVQMVAWDSSVEQPVIAAVMGNEMFLVRMERDIDRLYMWHGFQWLRRKPTSSTARPVLAALPADASPFRKRMRAYRDAVWSELLPKINTLDVQGIGQETNRLAEEYFKGHEELVKQEAQRILAELPKAEPIDRSRWVSRLSESEKKQLDSCFEDLNKAASSSGYWPHAWNPVSVAESARMRCLLNTMGPEFLGIRSMIVTAAGQSLDTVADADPDHPALVQRIGDEITIIHLRRTQQGTYELDDFEWLVRAGGDPAESESVPQVVLPGSGADSGKDQTLHEYPGPRGRIEARDASDDSGDGVATDILTLSDVRTLADLTQCKELKVDDTPWRVRIGLGDGGDEAGPWKLVYCLASYAADGDATLSHEGQTPDLMLGPVFVEVLGDDDTKLGQPRGMSAMQRTLPGRKCLFAAVVPTAWEGTYRLRIRSPSGQLLAERRLKVTDPPPCYWAEFAIKQDRDAARGEPAWAVSFDPAAARPACGNVQPLFVFDHRKFACDFERLELPGTIPLPHQWSSIFGIQWGPVKLGEAPPPLLRLSQAAGVLTIDSDVKIVTWADLHLLARWWVNGEPVLPPRPDGVSMIGLARRVAYGNRMRVSLALPDMLGEVKAGDRVALQVLYVPGGSVQLPRNRMSGEMALGLSAPAGPAASVPLLSNRLELDIVSAEDTEDGVR